MHAGTFHTYKTSRPRLCTCIKLKIPQNTKKSKSMHTPRNVTKLGDKHNPTSQSPKQELLKQNPNKSYLRNPNLVHKHMHSPQNSAKLRMPTYLDVAHDFRGTIRDKDTCRVEIRSWNQGENKKKVSNKGLDSFWTLLYKWFSTKLQFCHSPFFA